MTSISKFRNKIFAICLLFAFARLNAQVLITPDHQGIGTSTSYISSKFTCKIVLGVKNNFNDEPNYFHIPSDRFFQIGIGFETRSNAMTNIKNGNTGHVNFAQALATNDRLEVDGFLRLGSDARKFKTKEINLNDNRPDGCIVTAVSHSIGNIEKILAFIIHVLANTNLCLSHSYPSLFSYFNSFDSFHSFLSNPPVESGNMKRVGIKILFT